jgi:hypothetical protein
MTSQASIDFSTRNLLHGFGDFVKWLWGELMHKETYPIGYDAVWSGRNL